VGHFGFIDLVLPVFHIGCFKNTMNVLQARQNKTPPLPALFVLAFRDALDRLLTPADHVLPFSLLAVHL